MRHLSTWRGRHRRAIAPAIHACSNIVKARDMSESTRSLSKNDWILAALRVMDEHGVHEVKVSTLASALGVTKGSFLNIIL